LAGKGAELGEKSGTLGDQKLSGDFPDLSITSIFRTQVVMFKWLK